MKLLRIADFIVPATGFAAAAIIAAFGLTQMAVGAVAGAVIGTTSWVLLRFLGSRLMRGGEKRRALIASLMGSKILLMAALLWVAIGPLGFDGIGVAAGLSALPLGLVVMSLASSLGAAQTPSDEAATEAEGDA